MIPKVYPIMLHMLEALTDGKTWRMKLLTETLAAKLRLTEEEQNRRLPNGRERVFANRLGWAKTRLKAAKFIDNPERGVVRISRLGRQAFAKCSGKIDRKFLMQYDKRKKAKA